MGRVNVRSRPTPRQRIARGAAMYARQTVGGRAERHRQAAKSHEAAAVRHDAAAARWSEQGNEELAELERRNAQIERAAAVLERDRAAYLDQHGRGESGEHAGRE